MSDLKVGDRVKLPTDPEAYSNIAITRDYFDEFVLTAKEIEVRPIEEALLYLDSGEKAKLLGGREGTVDEIGADGEAVVDLDPIEGQGIAFSIPGATLTPATA